MRGSIHTEEKCPECGSSFVRDDNRRGLFCPGHPDQRAKGRFRVHFGRQTKRRFGNYFEAERFLTGLRYEVDKGTYDPRDYQSENPLGFSVLADKWLAVKEKEIKPRSSANLRNYMTKAKGEWGARNIKSLGFGEMEDFLYSLSVSDKTRSNIKSCLLTFWTWLRKRKVIRQNQMPEFPEISYELGFRKVVDKETQQAIIEEVKRISYRVNPKIWLGIRWLATYISIRPAELIGLKEKDIDLKSGFFFIPHPKEKRPKVVPLLDDDIAIVSAFPRGLPHLYFFRHGPGLQGVQAGEKFGPRYLYKWWKKACDNLGVVGVDLYGGTRHSTALALRENFTPEQIRRATMHSTNKAFERYFRVESEEVKDVYQDALLGKPRGNQKRKRETSN